MRGSSFISFLRLPLARLPRNRISPKQKAHNKPIKPIRINAFAECAPARKSDLPPIRPPTHSPDPMNINICLSFSLLYPWVILRGHESENRAVLRAGPLTDIRNHVEW